MEKRKKILIVIFALVVLLGSIFFATKKIGNKKQDNSSAKTLTAEQEKSRTEMLSHRIPDGQIITTGNIEGNVETVDAKSLTVKNDKEAIIVNLSANVHVTIATIGVKNQIAVGKMTDLKEDDSVKVTYDTATKNALAIAVVRTEMAQKTK